MYNYGRTIKFMDKIASFQVNHNKLKKGIYISREDMGIITYDLRMKMPNTNDLLSNSAIHTIEHLFASYVRNSLYKNNIIYFGPMGCRTGMYFIVRDLQHKNAIELIKQSILFILNFEGEIPGCSSVECGNYKEHSLEQAKREAKMYYDEIKDWTVQKLDYTFSA